MIDVDVTIERGDFRLAATFLSDASIVGLFGRSGAGKTSVINAIAGIVRPTRGHVRIDGVTLFDAKLAVDLPIRLRRIGYVFQHALLFPHLSVESNLLYGLRLRSRDERRIEPTDVIALLGLGQLLSRKPASLSGGERQRVAIGRALLAQPRVLLMDEPLASLDMQRKTEILDYIERLRDRLSIPIVYVSHSIAEIARLADTVVVLADGRSVDAGHADSVLARLGHDPLGDADESGSLIDAHVVAQDVFDCLTTLAFDGGTMIVPQVDAKIGERVRAYVRSRDIALSLERPDGISILNVLSGTITSISESTVAMLDVGVSVGNVRFTARITRRSLRELDLENGLQVHVLIKAMSFDHGSMGYH